MGTRWESTGNEMGTKKGLFKFKLVGIGIVLGLKWERDGKVPGTRWE